MFSEVFLDMFVVLPSQMPARIIKASSDHIKVAPLGKGTFLNCVYSGNPAPEVYWTKNGKRLDNKCAFCVHKVQHFYRKSTLRVTPYRDTDFGGYKCRARNKLGFGDITIKLEEDKSQSKFCVVWHMLSIHVPRTWVYGDEGIRFKDVIHVAIFSSCFEP